jgi:hypothetical protein
VKTLGTSVGIAAYRPGHHAPRFNYLSLRCDHYLQVNVQEAFSRLEARRVCDVIVDVFRAFISAIVIRACLLFFPQFLLSVVGPLRLVTGAGWTGVTRHHQEGSWTGS